MKNIFARWVANPRTTLLGAVTVGLSAAAIVHNPTVALSAFTDPSMQTTGPVAALFSGIGLLFGSDDTKPDTKTVEAIVDAKLGTGTGAPQTPQPIVDPGTPRQ